MAAVLVFIETHDGKLKKSAGEVMGQAQRLAGSLGGGIDAVIVVTPSAARFLKATSPSGWAPWRHLSDHSM